MPIQISRKLTGAMVAAGLALSATPAAAWEAGDWLVRGRLINVAPDDSSSAVSIAGAAVPGSGVSVDSAVTLDIDFTYMMTRNWGAELLLDLSSKHDVSATGSLSALGQIVSARVLPPALLLQYHFAPGAKVQPYAGVGLNYTYFFDEDASASLAGALGGSASVDLDSSWGLAAQVGADIDLNNGWFLNVDLKYIDINTTANITAPAGLTRVDVDINPWVYGIGLGKRF
jgi:outer membrane protein